MKKQGLNPYLPSWEYIPDGEPHVFDGRVYVYGSHDSYNGYVYCLEDYVCWSAPEDDLKDWRYEGVIYKRTADPANADGGQCLFAPDVTKGPDGRYYLYYVLNGLDVVSVAVCDTPAGEYSFHGYVSYPGGVRVGEREGDQPQFDPAVLTEGDRTYMYTGFCLQGDDSRKGAMATVLGADMLTVVEEPVFIAPGDCYGKGTSFEGHEFFEAPSIRKFGELYYFVYSSAAMHELCYATSRRPAGDFTYRGVVVSNCDKYISGYKPADMESYFKGNNHGGILKTKGNYYIFYHRHTNGTSFSRQGCAEPIRIGEDGAIEQAGMTSCGLNGAPLNGAGEYPAYIACTLYVKGLTGETPAHHDSWLDGRFPKITRDGPEGDAYIANMREGAVAGFRYFDCRGVRKISATTRGYGAGRFEVKTAPDAAPLGKIRVTPENYWCTFTANISIPDGVHGLYLEYRGEGGCALKSFSLE